MAKIRKMNINIKYSLIVSKCKLLSEYEAEQAESGAFANILLTDSEDELLKQYIGQAIAKIEESLQGAIVSIVDLNADVQGENVITLEMSNSFAVTGGGRATGSFVNSINETCATYCIYMWLLNKLPERSKAYQNMFEDMKGACRALAWKRIKPKMEE